MATTFSILPFTSWPATVLGTATAGNQASFFSNATLSGTTDIGTAITAASDSIELVSTIGSAFVVDGGFQDPGAGVFPASALITSVTFSVRIKVTGVGPSDWVGTPFIQLVSNGAVGSITLTGLPTTPSGDYQTYNSSPLTTNPATALAWTRADLFLTADPLTNPSTVYALTGPSGDASDKAYFDYFTISVSSSIDMSNPQIRAYDGYTDKVFARIPSAT